MTTNPNQQTERRAFTILKDKYGDQIHFGIEPEEKKRIYKLTQRYLDKRGICFDFCYKKYYRAVDGILLKGIEKLCEIKSPCDFEFIEVKSTRKNIVKLPYGAFFAFTPNEKELLGKLPNYKLCIVQVENEKFEFIDSCQYEKLCKDIRNIHYVRIKKEQ